MLCNGSACLTDVASDNGTSCNSAVATTIDDDPDSPGGDWCTADVCDSSSVATWSFRVGFSTPTNNPSTATDAQTFAFYTRRCNATAGNGAPTITVDYYCNSTQVEAGVAKDSSTTGSLHTDVYTHNTGSCAADGSDVEAHIVNTPYTSGSPGGRKSSDFDAIEWRVTWASATRRFMNIGYDEVVKPEWIKCYEAGVEIDCKTKGIDIR